ncbi:hypothetical protein [Bradyrhizobium sp. 192]|uniref:hypothetical protein n=1 Tax=Bradyrhizobium sp. 192 TaxID=2782660 RepID=UPI0020000014|nr:hypothetical protein [Bradyrhizobium sp. 192]UPJ60532.1 hypothetical protein IVB24_13345 [Bradyrhizobium sp. 192]
MSFQVTVLKILVSYPDGFAVMEDLKRNMAILATSGRDWADWTRRLAARVSDLDIFSRRLVERQAGDWKIIFRGRAVLEFMEARSKVGRPFEAPRLDTTNSPVPPLPPGAERAQRRRERRERRREGRERARANAS